MYRAARLRRTARLVARRTCVLAVEAGTGMTTSKATQACSAIPAGVVPSHRNPMPSSPAPCGVDGPVSLSAPGAGIVFATGLNNETEES